MFSFFKRKKKDKIVFRTIKPISVQQRQKLKEVLTEAFENDFDVVVYDGTEVEFINRIFYA